MSGFSPNATPSQPQSRPTNPHSPCLTEFAALVRNLQEAIESLMPFCRQQQRAEGSAAKLNDYGINELAGQQKTPHETRCYQIPGNILNEEREMLEFYKAENWQELFGKAHDQIYATVLLMERISTDEELDGFSLSLIAENLMMSLRMLSRLCSLIADFRLVHVIKVA